VAVFVPEFGFTVEHKVQPAVPVLLLNVSAGQMAHELTKKPTTLGFLRK